MAHSRLVLALVAGLLGSGCVATDASAGIYWGTSSGAVAHADLDGSHVNESFVTGAQFAYPAVDGQHVYWANQAMPGSIGRANLDGSSANQSFISPNPDSSRFGTLEAAVDGQHVYWTGDGNPGSIGRANLDGSGANESFLPAGQSPRGIAVDAQHIYWSNGGGSGVSGTIGRANLDGGAADQSFITAPNAQILAVAVDGQHIYWTNSYNGCCPSPAIGRANLDGTGVNQSFITLSTGASGLAVDDQHIYWSTGGKIQRANLDGSGINPSFITNSAGAGSALGIAVDPAAVSACPSPQVASVTVGHAVAQGCFNARVDAQGKATGVYDTSDVAWVGGFEFHPRPGGGLVVDTNAPGVSESGAGVDLIMAGFKFPFPPSLLPVGLTDATIDINQPGTALQALDLPLSGAVSVKWTDGGTSTSFSAKLGLESLTSLLGDKPTLTDPEELNKLSGELSARLVNGQGVVLDSFQVAIGELAVIPRPFPTDHVLKLKDLLLKLETRNGKPLWTGQAGISLPLTRGDLDVIGRAFLFDGQLAGGGLTVDGINKEIPDTPLVLQKVDGDLQFAPALAYDVAVSGTFGPKINGKPLMTIDGQFKYGAFAKDCGNGSAPDEIVYAGSLTPLEALTNAGLVKATFTGTTCIYLGTAPGMEVIGAASVDFLSKALHYEASQSGLVSTRGFDLEGSASLTLPALPDIRGQAIASNVGIAACGSISFFQGGFSYRFGQPGAPDAFTGCDLSPFRVAATARSATSRRSAAVTVAGGLPLAAFKASSASGPPGLVLTGPGGTKIRATRNVRTRRLVVVLDQPEKTTYVIVRGPGGGRWHIGADRPLESVAAARGLPRPQVTVRVRKARKKLVLTYRVRRIAGQRVELFEHAAGFDHDLGAAKGARGKLTFTPAGGGPTKRTVEAHITENGLPRAIIRGARFTVG